MRKEELIRRVWKELRDGLQHPEKITAGIRLLIEQLENSDEQADLLNADARLIRIEQKLLSYAEQRSEGLITSDQQRELSAPLLDQQQSLLEEKVKLQARTQRIHEASELLAYVEPVARKLAGCLDELNDAEKAIVIRAECKRIWVDPADET